MAGKGKRGAKSKYITLDIENRLPEIEQMARDGYRDEDIFKTLGIGHQTFYKWMDQHEEFAAAVRKGKAVVDAEIENKLLDSARGHVFWEQTQELMEVRDEKTGKKEQKLVTTKRVLKYVKPEVAAQIFWLKNRLPHKWRDKQQVEHSGGIGLGNLDYMSDDELDKALKGLKMDD